MQEQFNEILDQLRGIWLKRRYILVSAWLLCPIGWFAVSMIPNSYESSARVYVDTDSMLAPLLEGMTVEADTDKKIDLMVKTLLSRSNLERIARMTELDVTAIGEIEYEIMIQELSDEFTINKERKDNIYTLSITDNDPMLAKKIVEAALSVFIDNTLVDNRAEANEALRFLDSQIRDYMKKLKDSEGAIAKYKKENSKVLPDYAKGFYAHLNDETTRLSDAKLEYAVVQSELTKLKESLYNRAESTNFASAYDQRISDVQQRLDNALLGYTDAHPNVILARNRIETLKSLKQQEINDFKQMSLDNKRDQFDLNSDSPIIQGMQIKISELEGRSFALKVKADNYQQRIDVLVSRIDLIPAVEAHITELNRNYEINKKQYEDLLFRRESASISNSMEEETDNIHFKIIDPPRIATEPKGPKRLLLLLGVTLAAFGVGVGLSFLHSQVVPVVLTNIQIAKEMSLPVYGISYATEVSGIPKWEKRKNWIFIISNVALFSCLIALIGWHMKDNILLLLNKAL